MANLTENQEKARVLIEKYLSNTVLPYDFFLSREDFNTLLNLSTDPEKGKVYAAMFLHELLLSDLSDWNPSGCEDNQFERFVQDQESKPTQTPHYWVSVKEAKDIVDWMIAQPDWLS